MFLIIQNINLSIHNQKIYISGKYSPRRFICESNLFRKTLYIKKKLIADRPSRIFVNNKRGIPFPIDIFFGCRKANEFPW